MDTHNPITRRAALTGAVMSSIASTVAVSSQVPHREEQTAIAILFADWCAARGSCDAADTEAEALAHHARYVRLQRRITAMRPATARDAAIQLMVETDDNGSEYRDAFYRRVRKLAMEG